MIVRILSFLCFFALPAAAQTIDTTRLYEGKKICVYDVDAIADTDWHDLTASSFYDVAAADSTACPSNLKFVSVTWVNTSANAGRLKLLARTIPGDPSTHRLIAAANAVMSWPIRGIYNTSNAFPTTISIQLGNAADTGQIIVVLE